VNHKLRKEMKLKSVLTVMTWNVYLGADLTPLITTMSAQDIPKRVTEVFRQFLATHVPVRAKAIALHIASKKPDLVGLQEAELFQLIVPHVNIVTYDFVELLLGELRNLGLHYEVAAKNDNLPVLLPSIQGNLVRFLDRDVILKRKGIGLKVVRKQIANFNTNFEVQIGGEMIEIVRGWSSIDVKAHKRTFRVINTHLDPASPDVQAAQANELLKGPADTKLPLILLGDLNSNADGTGTPTYGQLLDAGFKDAWNEAGKGDGFTCCHDPDLLNAISTLSERIDYILFKNGWKPIIAKVVGEAQCDRTPTALWPSDHAGVVASFVIKKMHC
jgi:endonuclease/exonuclease/phosphatase family metal-dependent hydrolase